MAKENLPELADALKDRQELEDQYFASIEAENDFIRESIVSFHRIDILMEAVLGYEVMPCHRHMLIFQNSNPKTLTMAPRGIGKSTALTVIRAIFELVLNPNLRILIVSNTQLQAEIFLREIKQHFEANSRFIEIFGNLVGTKWDSKEINVKTRKTFAKESSISCCGVGGAIIGRHYDLIIGDDLVDEENSRTDLQRERFKIWFYKSLDPTLEPDGRMFIHGTRYYPSDHYGHLIKYDEQYKCRSYPAISKKRDGHRTTLWPEKMSLEWLDAKKKAMGSALFATQYQNDVSLLEGKIFRYEDMKFYDDLPREGLRIFQGVDLAIKQKETADYFVICTIGKDQYNNIYLIDIFYKRLTFLQQTEAIKKRFELFKPLRVYIEANAYQDSQSQVLLSTTDVRVVPIITLKDKVTRAWHLAHKFESGQVFFPKIGRAHV